MIDRGFGVAGSSGWVRTRIGSVLDEGAEDGNLAGELVHWLYGVARSKAAKRRVPMSSREEIVQDAVAALIGSVRRHDDNFLSAANPAAMVEKAMARAVDLAVHRARMAGLGGVAANGRSWRMRYPITVSGEAAMRYMLQLPDPVHVPDATAPAAAARVAAWTSRRLHVDINPDVNDAIVYALDRIASGVSRATLVRGGHSRLHADPAMRHLGFSEGATRVFAAWLFGYPHSDRPMRGVIDCALLGELAGAERIARWRTEALRHGFGVAVDSPSARSA